MKQFLTLLLLIVGLKCFGQPTLPTGAVTNSNTNIVKNSLHFNYYKINNVASNQMVTLEWDNSGAAQYLVFQSNCFTNQLIGVTSNNYYNVSNLTGGQSLCFYVEATNGGLVSLPSNFSKYIVPGVFRISISNNMATLHFVLQDGYKYAILKSTDLQTWNQIYTINNQSNQWVYFVDTNSSQYGFYKLKLQIN